MNLISTKMESNNCVNKILVVKHIFSQLEFLVNESLIKLNQHQNLITFIITLTRYNLFFPLTTIFFFTVLYSLLISP